MTSRRYASDVGVDRYDDRRDHRSRYVEEDLEYRRRPGQTVERDVVVREEVRPRPRSPPEWVRDAYSPRGPPPAGAMVLRARETEELEFVPRPRRRTPSPEPEKRVEKEEIIIRKDREESESRPPHRHRDHRDHRDQEEIIIRRDERDRGPPSREVERDREEVIIRRDEGGRKSRYEVDYDDVVSHRGDHGRRPTRDKYEQEEIIIRRDERDSDDRDSRYTSRRYDHGLDARPKSHERARSHVRRSNSESDQEIIIRREEKDGRGGEREKQEIIIRKRTDSRSPSPSSASIRGPVDPPVIHAPPIHQEIITHHRHIDHGYEMAIPTRRAVSRPPSPPMPPTEREHSEERIEIHRRGERNGKAYDEDIIIDRNDSSRQAPAPREPYQEPVPNSREVGLPNPYYDRDVREEAQYYNDRAVERSYPGEGYHGATRDWAIVDVPPGTRRVRMDGIGGARQDITWQRYNGVRRSKFMPDGASDESYSEVGRPSGEVGRPLPPPAAGGDIGARYGRERDPRDGLWTEITKDLVVKEAIIEMGYEFEETDDFYYVMEYLRFEDVNHLVGLSEDIRKDRRQRIKEIEWENRIRPAHEEFPPPGRLAIEPPPMPRPRGDWDREDERYIEREVVYRGGRPPPPVRWQR